MSGIVGILNTDGAPVSSGLLQQVTDSLAFRGPDAQEIWLDGAVGFGHTLLKTTPESENEHQPFSLGTAWIVADARVDGRRDLIGKLKDYNHGTLTEATDVELILRAYQAWGENCVDHLIGDFCFAIWDALRQRLFCARDQIGVKPFFYTRGGSSFAFSNTLDCLRLHPCVTGRLNDLAVADFLLFEMNQDRATTVFVDIQRLPAGHTLTYERGKLSVRQYWSLPVATPVHYSRDEEYVEHFHELFDTVIADRMRTDNAGVLMSGGLDSSMVAASARGIYARSGRQFDLRAYTQVFESLIPHEERYYSGLVAEALKIPIKYQTDDHLQLYGTVTNPGYRHMEPIHSAWPDGSTEQLRKIAVHSHVALTGFGADPAFSCRITRHFRELFKTRQFGRAMADATGFLTAENRLSRLYIRTRLGILFASDSRSPSYPSWLNENLEQQLSLRDRWETLNHNAPHLAALRPEAHGAVSNPTWAHLFESYDAGLTRVPVEVRHPFFDVRLVDFLLGLPTLPWCSDKQLLREAGRGILPDEVRLRRKSPLAVDPLVALLKRPEAAWVDRFEAVPELAHYVVRDRIPPVLGETDSWSAWIHLRPLSLNFWLRQLSPLRTNEAARNHRESVCRE